VKDKTKPQVLVTAARVYQQLRTLHDYSFVCKSPLNTVNSMRMLLPRAPLKIVVTDANGASVQPLGQSWDERSHTYYLSFDNSPNGIHVKFDW